jgi:hypothetical protein
MTTKQMEIVQALKEARTLGRVEEEARLLSQYQQVLKLSRMTAK